MSDDASARPGRLIRMPATITCAVTLPEIFGIVAGAIAGRRAA
jgi:hypothetical protein